LAKSPVKFGIDLLASNPSLSKNWGRCGLLANQASVDERLVNAWKIAQSSLDSRLVSLFGPQHGYSGTVQYNMIETNHGTHLDSGLPVYSLYGETRQPTGEMLSGLDTLVIDLQITGCRIYTWKATIDLCLRAAKEHNKRVVILDRPNPLGGELLEGRTLDPEARSFVGSGAFPMRHGLSTGEAARFLNIGVEAELEVVEMQGWDPTQYWSDLGRPWILTSPMLPHVDPLYVYPGLVLMEGTNLSEGRGTTLPFQFVGAPYLKNAHQLMEETIRLAGGQLPGVRLREVSFLPTWNKWQGEECQGVHIVVDNFKAIQSFNLALCLIKAFSIQCPEGFAFEKPGYEYDFKNLPINLLLGALKADQHITKSDFSKDDPFWSEGIEDFIETASGILLYDRELKLNI
jgi:uncharacterized protein YbbC (DUF1343 family)